MKIKILLTTLMISLLSIAAFQSAQADGKLFVSPTRVQLNDKYKVEMINVSNVTQKPRTYQVSVVDLVMNAKGVTEPSDNSPYSAKKMIRFFPREFTLQPGERQAVRVMTKLPAGTPDGEYHSHIKFFEPVKAAETTPTSGASGTRMKAEFSYSTLLPIIVSKGKIDTVIKWVNPSVVKSAKPGFYTAKALVTRAGNGQGNAFIDIIYVSPSGEKTQISNRRTHYIYREIDQKDFNFDFKLPEGASPGGKIELTLYTGTRQKPVLVDQVSQPIP